MTPELIAAETLSQVEFDQAEALLIGLLREAYPALDLRRGTALRDLLVRPQSAAYALETRRNDELLRTRSLAAIVETPGADDVDTVNTVLANFNTALRIGYASAGTLKISVSASSTYRLGAGAAFTAADTGITYTVTSTVVARASDGTLLGPDESGYLYFTAPVSAVVENAITAGTAFSAAVPFSGYVAAVAYSDFTPGKADETAEEAIQRLPATVASRGLVTRASITTAFTDPTSPGYNSSVRALSIQGMGDIAQQRDRRNVHGLPLGGRTDVYARTFSDPPVVVLRKQGTLQVDGTYRVIIRPEEAPGLYAIKSVSYDGGVLSSGYATDSAVAIGSLEFAITRFSSVSSAPSYRFDAADSTIGTVYHGIELYVHGVEAAASAPMLRIEAYAAADIGTLQTYADRPDVRNTGADLLVRAPFICMVGLRLVVKVAAGSTVDIAAMRRTITDVVNRNSFSGVLTMSEIVAAAHTYAITSVDTASGRHGGFDMRGYVLDGAGVAHTLQGHRLDIGDIRDSTGLLDRLTCVFATSTDRVAIEAVTA